MKEITLKRIVESVYLNKDFNKSQFKNFNIFNRNRYYDVERTYLQSITYSLEREFGLKTKTLDEVKHILGRKYKQLLKNFGPLLNHLRTSCYRKDHYVIERPLSTTNQCLLKYYGNNQTVRNYIIFFEELNVIKDVTPRQTTTLPDGSISPYVINREDFYKFGIPNTYIFNPLEIENLINIVKQFDPEWNRHSAYSIFKKRGNKAKNELLKKYQNKCWIGKTLRVNNSTENRNALIKGLQTNYQYLDYFCDELTKDVNSSDLIHFKNVYCPKVNVSKSKKSINSFGIRNTNSLCNNKKDEDEESDTLCHDSIIGDYIYTKSSDYCKYRDGVLKDLWGVDKIYNYDVKSSILRVMYLLEHGQWLDDSVDFHQMLFNYKFESKEDRTMAKGFDLIFTFSKSVDDFISKQRFALYKDGFMVRTGTFTYKAKQQLKDELVKFDKKMCDIFGLYRNIGSEIFYHESNIYLMVQKRIQKELGIKYEVVYDAFYSPDERITQIQSIVKECALEYYNNYLTNNSYIKKPKINSNNNQNSTNISSVNVCNINNIIINKDSSGNNNIIYICTIIGNTKNVLDYDEVMKRFYEQNHIVQNVNTGYEKVTTFDNMLL